FHIVGVRLLGPEVVTFSLHLKSQQCAVESETPFGVGHDDGGWIDAEKHPEAGAVPFRVALVGRELKDLERMAVGVLEVEGTNTGGVGNGFRKELRLSRSEPHVVGTKDPIGAVHVADDDGDML